MVIQAAIGAGELGAGGLSAGSIGAGEDRGVCVARARARDRGIGIDNNAGLILTRIPCRIDISLCESPRIDILKAISFKVNEKWVI